MSTFVAWIAAEAEKPERIEPGQRKPPQRAEGLRVSKFATQVLPAHQFPTPTVEVEEKPAPPEAEEVQLEAVNDAVDEKPYLRAYRNHTVLMLRRYMRCSLEIGRLPSVLGREFFRAKVSTYTVVTFEDRVIFVHDMEKCVERLDEFSRQLLARSILQEHDLWATARLLHCNEKTVRRSLPMAIDLLSEILLEAGLMKRLESIREKSCQGGENGKFSASDCEDGKYKF